MRAYVAPAFLAMLSALLACATSAGSSAQVVTGCALPTTIERFPIDGAIGSTFDRASGTLAFGKEDAGGHFDTFLSDQWGNGARQLTWNEWHDDRHQYPAAFHPGGRYLMMLVEKNEHAGNSVPATPGYGAYSDFWLVSTDGQRAWKLVEGAGDRDNAFTHAAFSPDGTEFVWTERIKYPQLFNMALLAGSYRFNIADFAFVDGAPRLSNIRHIVPGGKPQGGEVESIAADNRTILFHSTIGSGNLLASRIYRMDIAGGAPVELTTRSFAQAPRFTFDQRKIVYMTGDEGSAGGADWWMMNPDGSGKLRLTTMTKKGSQQYLSGHHLAGSFTFLSDDVFLGDVLTRVFGLTGYMVRVTIKPECRR